MTTCDLDPRALRPLSDMHAGAEVVKRELGRGRSYDDVDRVVVDERGDAYRCQRDRMQQLDIVDARRREAGDRLRDLRHRFESDNGGKERLAAEGVVFEI